MKNKRYLFCTIKQLFSYPLRINDPSIPPQHWTMTYKIARKGLIFHATTIAMETAGLM